MPLFNRLAGDEGVVKIPIHAFMAALAEYGRGALAQKTIIKHWALEADEEADLRAFFLDKQDAKAKAGDSTREYAAIVHDVLVLSEARFEGYATADEVAGTLKGLL